MMKKLFLAVAITFSASAYSWEAPEILSNLCYDGCAPKIQSTYDDFLNTPHAPTFIPGMYSGVCNHISGLLNPETDHYIGLLLNTDKKGAYMAPVLQYFGEGNDMADWSLEDGLLNMSPDWIEAGRITTHKTSMTAQVLNSDGYPVLVYWARQNPQTKEVLFLAFLGGNYAACRLTPNLNGLP